jgi:hypothetical protein
MYEMPITALSAKSCSFTRPLARLLFACICGTLIFCGHPLFAADEAPAKNVLILFSFSDRNLTAVNAQLVETTVRSRVNVPVNFYVEYLESKRFENIGYEESLSTALHHAYNKVKLDAVLTNAHPALSFAIKQRDQIFPGVPIVFMGVDSRRLVGLNLAGVTGITYPVDIRGTLDLTLRLHPGTTTLAVVAGTSSFEQYWLKAFHDEFGLYEKRLKLITWSDFQSSSY